VTVSGNTSIFGIIGNPIHHSLSPIFWNAALQAKKIDAVYVPFQVEMTKLRDALKGFRSLSIKGFNVTRPFKEKVVKYLDHLVAPAKELKIVNTVLRNPTGKMIGYNTDAGAFLSLFKKIKKPIAVTLLGAGGSGKTAFWSLCQSKFEMVYWSNRTPKRVKFNSEKQPTKLKKLAWEKEELEKAMQDSSLIINTTSLGWLPEDDFPVLSRALNADKIYIDLNYSPDSRLVNRAKKAGAKVIDGLEFLIRQGIESFQILTGRKAPEKTIRDSLNRRLFGSRREEIS